MNRSILIAIHCKNPYFTHGLKCLIEERIAPQLSRDGLKIAVAENPALLTKHHGVSRIINLIDVRYNGVNEFITPRSVTRESVIFSIIRDIVRIQVRGNVYLIKNTLNCFLKAIYNVLTNKVIASDHITSFASLYLTFTERYIMNAIIAGRSIHDIARSLNMCVKTVYTYKYRAFTKCGIKTLADVFIVKNTILNTDSKL
ncbi:LuxR C-terminal-related transcriptional regulator [Enterobacter bugandensis]|uniref:LuxR C-terminal-related transcriptional regulator n=1 Tax=Enterobacter bugandensis TaxID=881260 RepID=UPI00283A9428|nr:LuxR C-terminal-related transcriptional regulator [Enterobacter bugandensis]WMU74483.1 LuxR C-terminal-related transcriptional regulator [Enterobacter bugandensis]